MSACEERTNRQSDTKVRSPTQANTLQAGVGTTLTEYCDNTSLHCFKYLVKSNRPITERLCWALAILTSLICCSVPIYQVWLKWKISPVIVTFAENSSPTASLPFPTVTVCPSVKYRPVHFDYKRMTEKERAKLLDEEGGKIDSINMVCDDEIFFSGEEHPYFTNETSIEYIKQLAPSLSESVGCQYYLSGNVDCLEYMATVVSEEGVCFTFNALPNNAIYSPNTVQYNEKDSQMYKPIWTPEQGYVSREISLKRKPYRAFNVGVWNGLTLTLQLNTSEQDFDCSFNMGYKVILSNPADTLAVTDAGYYLPSNGFTQIAISPSVMDTSEDLRYYSSSKRHCLYPHERQLELFQIYTQENCKLECLTKFTLYKCGCVAFFMPRYKDTPICGPRSKECLYNASVELSILTMESVVFDDELDSCSCLPACKTIKYTADISQSNLELGNMVRNNSSSNSEFKNVSFNVVMIYFKESEFLASRRTELYGFGGFVAQCGGLLGLCCGFSILSLLEIIYYTTIRMWSDNCKRKKVVETKKQFIPDKENKDARDLGPS